MLVGGEEIRAGVRDDEVTARRYGVQQPGDDVVGVVGVGDRVQQREQGDRDRLLEVEEVAGLVEEPSRVSRTSASMYSVAPDSLLTSRARAWASTMGS